jgi:O-antigen/teichoic acid export membrane protein
MMFILLIPAVIGLALTGNALLRILATDDFAQGALLVAMIALGVALDTIGNALQYIFYAQGRPQVLRNIYVQAAILNILANLVAIPLFSYNGAGLTTMLTFIYIFYSLWKKTEMPFSVLFDMNVFWRCLVISAVMGVWVALTVAPTIVGLGVAIVGGALIYGVGLLLLRVLALDDVLSVPRAVIRRFAP